ncbi:MAG: hypothetical protein HXX16_03335 [Bacteroidales bacterium]|nr:hypothetical protein [Bacteroidales bacterium]
MRNLGSTNNLPLLESPDRDDILVKGKVKVFKNPARDEIVGTYFFRLLNSPKYNFIPMGFKEAEG